MINTTTTAATASNVATDVAIATTTATTADAGSAHAIAVWAATAAATAADINTAGVIVSLLSHMLVSQCTQG